MLYAIFCYDKPNGVSLRQSTRPKHLDYLGDAGDRVKIAGPLLGPGNGGAPIGSLIVIDAASEAAVQLFANNDPYTTAGLFERVEIHPWVRGIGVWGADG